MLRGDDGKLAVDPKSNSYWDYEKAYEGTDWSEGLEHAEAEFQISFKVPLNYGDLKALNTVEDLNVEKVRDKVIALRSAKLPDPRLLPNAGSFFKNPIITNQQLAELLKQFADLPHYEYGQSHHKVAAGWLIDQSGLKGHREAGIEVHQHQALVLVNHGNSEGSDLIKMIKHIQQVVYTRYNIMLEHEVRLMDARSECHINAEPK